MSTGLRRSGGFVFALLVGLGFDLSDFVGSTIIAYAVWLVAGVWAIYSLWPLLKRWRPFTLAPVERDSQHARSEDAKAETPPVSWQAQEQLREKLREAKEEREEIKQERNALQAENDGLIAELSDLITPSGGTAAYPLLKQEELSKTHIKKRTVYIADFAREVAGLGWRDAVIKERTFEDCYIIGPAVLVPMNTGEVGGHVFVGDDTWWEEGARDAFWSAAEWSGPYTGIVGIEDCVFRDCRFRRVGILFQEWELRQLRGEPDEGPGPEDVTADGPES